MKKKTNSSFNRGGLNLYQHKEPAFSRAQRQLLVPKVLYIPVEPGMDERAASAFLDEAIFLGIFHLEYPGVSHTEFGRYKLNAATDKGQGVEEKPLFNYDKEPDVYIETMEFDSLVDIAKRSFIIDETDGIALFKKLQLFKENGVDSIVADAIDEEPYVSSSINTLLQKGPQVMEALRIVGLAFAAAHTFGACYADMDDTRTVIPPKIADIPVQKLGGKYPVRKQLSSRLSKKNPGEKLGLIGVQALLHLYRAIYYGKKQNTTVVTVAGDCVGYSCNVEVAIGTTLQELLEFCGLVRDPSRVVIQGSMCGISMENLELPILHSEKAVLAFEKPIENRRLPCVNCGKCIQVCPAGLSPVFIHKNNKAGFTDTVRALKPERCIECGCCSYVCPAKLELSDTIIQLKRTFLKETEKVETPKKEEGN